MVTLEKKCTLISMFDALAYQYPCILYEHGLNTPLDLVQLMLEGKASDWGQHEFTHNKKKQFLSNESGHPVIYPFVCLYLKINMCVDGIPNLANTRTFLRGICSSSRPTVLNICEDGPNHVEFHPFPYVRTKRDQRLYEMYSENSRKQIKEYEHRKWMDEEFRATEWIMAEDDPWAEKIYEAFLEDLSL